MKNDGVCYLLFFSVQLSGPLCPPPKDGNQSPQKTLFSIWMVASWMYTFFSFTHLIIWLYFGPDGRLTKIIISESKDGSNELVLLSLQ